MFPERTRRPIWLLLAWSLCPPFSACGDPDPLQGQNPIESGTFSDNRDGSTYRWIQIGSQVWMAQNLGFASQTGSWCYDGDEGNCETYGRLYDWSTALDACPAGWHLPSDQEWTELESRLGSAPGTELKVGGGSEFDALLAGYRHYDGSFHNLGVSTSFWTSTPTTDDHSFERTLGEGLQGIHRDAYGIVGAISVRCVEDG